MIRAVVTHPLVHVAVIAFGLAAASPWIAGAVQFLVRYPQ